jgi:hypothetical protein
MAVLGKVLWVPDYDTQPVRRTTRSAGRVAARWMIVVCGLFVFGIGSSSQAALPSQEYQIKAVFLFHFAQFVEWPPQGFADGQTPLVIGVLGEDPFGGFLEETVRGEKVNSRTLLVQHYRRVEEIQACHVLFIGQSEANRLDQILSYLKDRSILTVSDVEDFAHRGGMIRFVMQQNKIRLKINVEAAKAANLTISSKLLRPADIVSTALK